MNISHFKKLGFVALSAVLFAQGVEHFFPAGGNKYEPNQMITCKGGVKKIVIGYFGSSDVVHKKGIIPERGLYYGDKKTCQSYALGRAKGEEKPVVAVIVADRRAKQEDHLPGLFEGYDPLGPTFIREANVELVDIEEVDLYTRIGFFGNVARLCDYVNQKISNPQQLPINSIRRYDEKD